MNTKAPTLSLADRLELVASGADVTVDELKDLAEYDSEIDGHANELGTKFADFAANVQMLLDPATPEDDHESLRASLTADAGASAAALRSLADLAEPPTGTAP